MRMTSLWHLDVEVVANLLHLWLSLFTFMVVQFITFMGRFLVIVTLLNLSAVVYSFIFCRLFLFVALIHFFFR